MVQVVTVRDSLFVDGVGTFPFFNCPCANINQANRASTIAMMNLVLLFLPLSLVIAVDVVVGFVSGQTEARTKVLSLEIIFSISSFSTTAYALSSLL